MRKIFLLLFSLVLLNSYGQERRVITTAVPFLMIASDARAAGMGEQGVATPMAVSYTHLTLPTKA